MPNILAQIEEKINYLDFYNDYVSNVTDLGDHQYQCLCPFHDEETPSFSFNGITGQYKCFAGSCLEEGNIYTFLEKKLNITVKKDRVQFLCKRLGIPMTEEDQELEGTVEKYVWKQFHDSLLGKNIILKKLQEKRGLTLETVKKFKLGYYKNRITIPIFDDEGECKNIRYYAFLNSGNGMKLLNHKDDTEYNFGKMRLFPIENLEKKKIILVEGEMDAILANQLGLNAVTVTSGAGSFNKLWGVKYFKRKQVWICYDIDQAGEKGAIKVAKQLAPIVDFVKIMRLADVLTDNKPGDDVTDFFITYGRTKEEFSLLAGKTIAFNDKPEYGKQVRNIEYKAVTLKDASHSSNALKYIEVKALVSGKDFPPFEIPNKVDCVCDRNAGEKVCPFCPMWGKEGKQEIVLQDEADQRGSLLNLIDVRDNVLFGNIKKQLGIPYKCDRVSMKTKSYINVEELRLIPEIDFSASADYEYVQQVAYYAGNDIKPNQVYTLKGIALPNPKTQQATQLFSDAIPAVDNIDMFEMTKEVNEELMKFQPEEDTLEGLGKFYVEKYKDIQHFSGIYERMDIALAYDITLHSALNVLFQKKKERGWMESLIIGDSGCGKTELAKNMILHYGVGEFVTGESVSVAGLIGGLSQTAKKWHINWGKIPLNNRRALFIDELSGLTVEDIGLFSGVRSSGIAELTKIRTEKTMAQTRKVWIGNPRKVGNTSRNMMQYPYGCVAVRELIGTLEDIRRFDFVLSAHSEEVDRKVYNQIKISNRIVKYTAPMCHSLLMWIWSRKEDQVKFTKEATKLILLKSGLMGQKYYHGIPIVEAADQRLKIMRGAVAIAGMTYSTDDGTNILVKTHHVDFFYNWLEKIYNKDSMRYGDWSKRELAKKVLKDEDEVNSVVKDDIVDMLLDNDTINQSILADLTGWDRSEIKYLFSTLNRNNAMQRVGTSFYRKTEAFNDYLIRRRNGEVVIKQTGQGDMLDDMPTEGEIF